MHSGTLAASAQVSGVGSRADRLAGARVQQPQVAQGSQQQVSCDCCSSTGVWHHTFDGKRVASSMLVEPAALAHGTSIDSRKGCGVASSKLIQQAAG